jgi:hypothetical protein
MSPRVARSVLVLLGAAAVGQIVARHLSSWLFPLINLPKDAVRTAVAVQSGPNVVGGFIAGLAFGFVAEDDELSWSMVGFVVALVVLMYGMILPFFFLPFLKGPLGLLATVVMGLIGVWCGRRLRGEQPVA